MKKMERGYYVYVLYSEKDGKRYTGMCKDLGERLDEHKKGKVKSTSGRLPLQLVYYEWCRYFKDAQRRERYLKSYYGKRYIKNRIQSFYSQKLKKWKN